MSGFRQAQFLSNTGSDYPSNRVRCPIHGFIHYSPNERNILSHPLFQRLRYIKQLALTELVYPGANHTRFEHTLGVMHVASDAFDTLARKHGDKLEAQFGLVDVCKEKPLAMARQILRVAALLHDVGHAAFSHAAEEAVLAGRGHESLSHELITRDDYFKPLLDGMFGAGFAALVGLVLKGSPDVPPQLEVLTSIVSGDMDADRSDYLIRDSYHCGVAYGHFEYRRLIESMTLIGEPGGKLELALKRDGLHAFEALILARYQMSTQVYYHRLRRIYDHYLVQYHKALPADTFDSGKKIVSENDVTMLNRIMADAQKAEPQSPWAKRIVTRSHHKVVFEPSIRTGAGHELRVGRKVFEEVKARFNDVDFVGDITPKPISIHKLLTSQDETGTDLMLVSSTGDRSAIVNASQVFSTLPKSFRQIRFFADVEDRAKRTEIADFARTRWNAEGGNV